MPITNIIYILLLLTVTIISIEPIHVNRTYNIHRDRIVGGNRLSEFSIFDSTGKQGLYRLKDYNSDIPAAVLYTYSMEQILGFIEGEWTDIIHYADICIVDTHFSACMDGSISNINRQFMFHEYKISWYGTNIIMKRKIVSMTTELHDEKGGDLVAKFELYPDKYDGDFLFDHFMKDYPIVDSWRSNKYNLTIFSDKIPDKVYFIALATMDYAMKRLEPSY